MQFLQLLTVLSLLALGTLAKEKDSGEKKSPMTGRSGTGRVFSVFNVVQFQNDPCLSTASNGSSASALHGTCLSASACASTAGGAAQGQCAAGFGVCCVVTTSGCNSQISQNCTYIQNLSGNSAACSYTILNPSSGTCSDTVTITRVSGPNPPVVCGILTGQHMYIDAVSTLATIATLNINIAAGTAQPYSVKVSFIECNSMNRAPTGCLQYFRGTTGNIQSFNFQGGRFLVNQYYRSCFRQELGMCQIEFREANGTSPAAIDSFFLSDSTTVGTMQGSNTQCPNTYLKIPTTADAEIGLHCGGSFNELTEQLIPGSILSNVAPFELETYANNVIFPNLVGFNLDFTEKPC